MSSQLRAEDARVRRRAVSAAAREEKQARAMQDAILRYLEPVLTQSESALLKSVRSQKL